MPSTAYTSKHRELVDNIHVISQTLMDIIHYIDYIKHNHNSNVEQVVLIEDLTQCVNTHIDNFLEYFQMTEDGKITSTYILTLPLGVLPNIAITHLQQIMKIEHIQSDEYMIFNPCLFKNEHFEIMRFVLNLLNNQYEFIQRQHTTSIKYTDIETDIFNKFNKLYKIYRHILTSYTDNPAFTGHHDSISLLIDRLSMSYESRLED